ncbi:uncharacterized protein LOC124137613 [Haliotis rufescens]|uniref:uncharacterized protein LOC124137613 n=1 Tax=Haliotis rufescens TaxID=6454 RepID=UPI00201F0F2C|nr:uncharacterized protein LOC124137613 [Haliotis rufescens]
MVIATLICCCLRAMREEEREGERERRGRTVIVVRDQHIDRAGLVQHEVMPDRSHPGRVVVVNRGVRTAGPYAGNQIPSRTIPAPYAANQIRPPADARNNQAPYTASQIRPPADARNNQAPYTASQIRPPADARNNPAPKKACQIRLPTDVPPPYTAYPLRKPQN